MPQTYRLPKEAYTTDKWMQAEFASLFSNAWVFAGVETDFQNVGDYRTVQAGLYPLAIVKAKDGTLQATHNVCRHRGTVLLDGQGNTGQSIVCPYHRWTYGLDGALRGAPNMATCFPELDRTKLALKQAGLGIFKGLIFLNPNPNANFNNWLSEIGEEIWPHNLEAEDIQEGPSLIYDMKCDWKVFVENAIDGYHLSYLHEHTLGGPTPDQNLWERRGEHLIWFSTENKGVRSALPAKVQSDIEKSWATPIKGTDISGYPGVVHLFPTTMVIPTPYGFSHTNSTRELPNARKELDPKRASPRPSKTHTRV
jgi:choline monooxygenase